MHTDYSISVSFQLALHAMVQVTQKDAKPFAPRQLESRNQIAIAGDNHDRLNGSVEGEKRDVQAYSKIDPFLLDVRNEIVRLDQSRLKQKRPESRRAQLPFVDV